LYVGFTFLNLSPLLRMGLKKGGVDATVLRLQADAPDLA